MARTPDGEGGESMTWHGRGYRIGQGVASGWSQVMKGRAERRNRVSVEGGSPHEWGCRDGGRRHHGWWQGSHRASIVRSWPMDSHGRVAMRWRGRWRWGRMGWQSIMERLGRRWPALGGSQIRGEGHGRWSLVARSVEVGGTWGSSELGSGRGRLLMTERCWDQWDLTVVMEVDGPLVDEGAGGLGDGCGEMTMEDGDGAWSVFK